MTTLPMTAEEVHKTGLAELERIKAEERAIAKKVAGTEDLDALFRQMQRPDQLWDTRDAVVASARRAASRAPRRPCRSTSAASRRPRSS